MSALKEDIFVDHRLSKYDTIDQMNISYTLCIADRILNGFNFKFHAIEFRLLVVHETRPRGYKTCFMLNSAEHEIYPAHKC